MLWLSHWRFENDELEEGEQVHVSINEEFSFWAKEFCIQLVYEKDPSNSEDIIIQQETPPSSQIAAGGNVSASASRYQFWTGKYFLCNHRARIHQHQFSRRQTNPSYLEHYKPETDTFRYLFDQDVHPQDNHSIYSEES